MVRSAVGAPGGGAHCSADRAVRSDQPYGNGCVWDSSVCVNRYSQCGILESEVATKCGGWAGCGGVVCRSDYGGYCLARRASELATAVVHSTMWTYTKRRRCAPTPSPTRRPTRAPSRQPTGTPTRAPTRSPTRFPTDIPTPSPTEDPTPQPSRTPTEVPTPQPSHTPTEHPTTLPPTTDEPTSSPTRTPTEHPTDQPTRTPTELPTPGPTGTPTVAPTFATSRCRRVCASDNCRGTWTNPIPRGAQWTTVANGVYSSSRGCCSFWSGACATCCH